MAFACLVLSTKANDDKNNVSTLLKAVTVYKSGAELQHQFSVILKQGNNEIWVNGISNNIDINSIQLKAPPAVTVMGIEFSNNYLVVPTEKSSRIKMLEDSLQTIDKEKEKINISITNTTELMEVLKANRDIKGTQTGLSVADLMKLMEYYKTKQLELQNDLSVFTEKKKKLDIQYNRIKNQIAEDDKKNTTTSGRLIIQFNAAIAGKYDFSFSYISPNAYWVPFYDVRMENITAPLKIIYKAKIFQTTGVDWKQVKLSLSNSVPSQWGNAPQIQSWYLGYINPVVAMDKTLSINKNLQARTAATAYPLNEVALVDYDIKDKKQNAYNTQPIYVVNGSIMDEQEFQKINPSAIKKMEIVKDATATNLYGARAVAGAIVVTLKDGLEDYVSVTDNTLNFLFDIDLPYDVPTTGKAQTATLKTIDAPALYKNYSIPKLDNDAYLLAIIPNGEKLNLLPGDANIIVEGTYVGKSFIDPNVTTDSLNLTLGKDKRIAVKRDKIVDYNSVKFLGSNKVQKYTYEITVKNNKKETVNLLLKDQYPLSTNKEIEVELIDAANAEVDKDSGILNWQLTLAAGESKKIRFTYSIKYPKDKTLNL
ncbi:MAG: mucoidy inhibitor MuiA family protein [Bacteroidetes bacterium]|nr:mucoidy inhibitor MuiA family protein [Bacteroidota bacterium]MBS1649837.1 mucoidy inhibitor MuiA family protein [Bacteroidota bacterium]